MSASDYPVPGFSGGSQPAAIRRWLSIVGIGEDGVDGLNAVARGLIQSAAVVFGADRHLSLASPLIRGSRRPWPRPFDEKLSEVLALRGTPVCILASGDPFQHGVGSVAARLVGAEEIVAVPAQSAFSLAASRLLWALPQTSLLSLCGRSLDFIRPHLQPGARILVLTSDQDAPAALSALLKRIGCGDSKLTVLEALGGPRERIRTTTAAKFAIDGIDPLNTVAIEVAADAAARILSRSAGLADDLFENDGQITKREVRAVTLSSLAPHCGDFLWDIGAGSGSVAIEWLLSDTSLRAVAIERSPDRAARIGRNAAAFGVPHLAIVESEALAGIAGLPAPDAVFIGGGATTPGLIEAARQSLRPRGRLVINAVSLETEVLLLQQHAQCGGALCRIAVSRAAPVGGADARMSSWRPAMPVVQWTWAKP
jgi:precorrin-6Y C5,15-methyltransferase (decarboxylating)